MLRIITHIERLLLVHDCVIVPKFGGFVLQTVSAMQDRTEHSFSPLRKEVVFNVTLQHNDGLLSESYMQMYEVNFRKAQLMLDEDVEDLKASLQQEKIVTLGVLGLFKIGEEGQIIFFPEKTDLFSVSSYGLPSFYFPALPPLQVEREEVALLTDGRKRKRDTFYIPVSRRLIRTVVASAAAIALFLLISTPVTDVNQDAYTASFVPTEMVTSKVASPLTVVSQAAVTEVNVQEEVHAVSATPSEGNVAVSDKQEVAPKPVEVKQNVKMYHIVIASFPSEAQADEYIAGVDKNECKHVSKVARDGKYRIYADRFDNREAAEIFMTILRKNPKYTDAWLFISR